jgi:hypothetical protein
VLSLRNVQYMSVNLYLSVHITLINLYYICIIMMINCASNLDTVTVGCVSGICYMCALHRLTTLGRDALRSETKDTSHLTQNTLVGSNYHLLYRYMVGFSKPPSRAGQWYSYYMVARTLLRLNCLFRDDICPFVPTGFTTNARHTIPTQFGANKN